MPQKSASPDRQSLPSDANSSEFSPASHSLISSDYFTGSSLSALNVKKDDQFA
jgi:hypothetical protein